MKVHCRVYPLGPIDGPPEQVGSLAHAMNDFVSQTGQRPEMQIVPLVMQSPFNNTPTSVILAVLWAIQTDGGTQR